MCDGVFGHWWRGLAVFGEWILVLLGLLGVLLTAWKSRRGEFW